MNATAVAPAPRRPNANPAMRAQPVFCRPLIERQAELELLRERRRGASAGRGGLVLVAGEAGVGKTRLLSEFSRSLAVPRLRVVLAHCREFAQRPYAPVLDLLAARTAAARIPGSVRG